MLKSNPSASPAWLAIHRSWLRAIAFGRPGRYSPRMAKKAGLTKANNPDEAPGFVRLNELCKKVSAKAQEKK